MHDRITNGGIELFVFSLCLLVFQNPNKNLSLTYTLSTLRLIGGSWPGEGRVKIYTEVPGERFVTMTGIKVMLELSVVNLGILLLSVLHIVH